MKFTVRMYNYSLCDTVLKGHLMIINQMVFIFNPSTSIKMSDQLTKIGKKNSGKPI